MHLDGFAVLSLCFYLLSGNVNYEKHSNDSFSGTSNVWWFVFQSMAMQRDVPKLKFGSLFILEINAF